MTSIPKRNDISKGYAMVGSHREMEIKRDKKKAHEGEPNLDRMAQ